MDFVDTNNEKQQKHRYSGHDLTKAVNERIKNNSKSMRHRNSDQKMTMSPYSNPHEMSIKHGNTANMKSDYAPYPQTSPDELNYPGAIDTMMGKYNERAMQSQQYPQGFHKGNIKTKRRTKRTGLVIKNGKLLISKNKTVH